MMLNRLVDEALELVNLYRVGLGFSKLCRLRAGFPSHCGACPLTRSMPGIIMISGKFASFERSLEAMNAALCWGLSSANIFKDDDGVMHRVPLPRQLIDFMEAFDRGDFPNLQMTKEKWGQA